MNSRTFYLAKEGHKGVLFLIVLVVLSLIFEFKFLAFLFFCCCLLWAFLFRDPERHSSYLSANAFLSPIDGKVRQIVFREDQAIVTIDVGLFDVGVLRAPIAFEKPCFSQMFGSPLFFSSKKSLLSPQSVIVFENHSMKIMQNLFHFPPIEAYRSCKQGEKIGFLKAGEVELVIKDIEIKINIGDQLKGGESVIGYLQ